MTLRAVVGPPRQRPGVPPSVGQLATRVSRNRPLCLQVMAHRARLGVDGVVGQFLGRDPVGVARRMVTRTTSNDAIWPTMSGVWDIFRTFEHRLEPALQQLCDAWLPKMAVMPQRGRAGREKSDHNGFWFAMSVSPRASGYFHSRYLPSSSRPRAHHVLSHASRIEPRTH